MKCYNKTKYTKSRVPIQFFSRPAIKALPNFVYKKGVYLGLASRRVSESMGILAEAPGASAFALRLLRQDKSPWSRHHTIGSKAQSRVCSCNGVRPHSREFAPYGM